MNGEYRRNFLKYLMAIPFAGTLFSCEHRQNISLRSTDQQLKKDPYAMEVSKAMTRDKVFSMLDKRVEQVMEKSHNCAQSTYFALSEQFGLGGDDILKALTPLP